jgi:prepilin-type processing-associated H-X9-DG protein
MIADREGSTSTSYGPFGGAVLLGAGPAAPVLATIAVARMASLVSEADVGVALSRDAAQRASCANNLKQMGIIFKMYANEHKGKFPVIDDRKGNLAAEGEEIFPEYLTDQNILRCPGSPEYESERGPWTADDITDESYFYLGWAIMTEEEGLALLDAYESLDLARRDEDLHVGEGKGNVGGDVIYRLREGIERFFITDINQPTGPAAQSRIPVMWERLGHHEHEGGNVLYMDGHVEFLKLGTFPMTEQFMRRLEEISPKKATE